MSQQTVRRVVLTASITAVTAVGTWYGAGLKTQKQARTVTEERREATTEEQLASLNERRSQLIGKRITIERKLAELEARRQGATRSESQMGQERKL